MAKILNNTPIKIAEDISLKINEIIEEDIQVNAVNGYINFNVKPKWLAKKLFDEAKKAGADAVKIFPIKIYIPCFKSFAIIN